jgi:hypothetical protein
MNERAQQWTVTVPNRTIRNAAVWLGLIVLLTAADVLLGHPLGMLGVVFAVGWIAGRELNR